MPKSTHKMTMKTNPAPGPTDLDESALRQQGYILTDEELLAEIGTPGKPPVAASFRGAQLPCVVYIWRVPDGRQRVVKLNNEGDGMTTLNDGDDWYFEHELVGTIHGPIYLSPHAN